MNRSLAEFIDQCALFLLHRKKSLKNHFRYNGVVPSMDPNAFYFKPPVPDISFNVIKNYGNYKTGEFYYKSEIENDKCNEYVSGTFYENISESQLNVVLVHGWRQDQSRIKAIFLKPFLENGFNVYFYSLPYHIERQGIESLYNGELMISADVNKTLTSLQQSVIDLRALISWIRMNRTGKILLDGISLGGLVCNLVATVEENIDGIISVFAPNELSHAIWNTIPGKHIKQDFKANSFSYDQLKACWNILNTSNFMTKIPKEKVLLFSALYDKYIDLKDADKLWQAWGKPERKLYQCGHAGIAFLKTDIANDSLAFIKNKVLGGI